eukprot:g2056.t1
MWERTVQIQTFMFFLLFPSIGTSLTKLFFCVEIEGKQYLYDDKSIECSGSDFTLLRVFGGFCAFAYLIAIPAVYIYILYQKRDLICNDDRENVNLSEYNSVRRKYGLLFRQYNGEAWFYEFIEMTRKLSMTAGLLLVPSIWSNVAGLSLSFGFAVALAHIDPYVDRLDSFLQNTVLTVLFITLLCAEIINHYSTAADAAAIILVSANVILALITLATLYFVWGRFYDTLLKESQSKKGFKAALYRVTHLAGRKIKEKKEALRKRRGRQDLELG